MRRVLGVVLAGAGAFFIVLALMGRFVLPGQVVKFPLNEYNVSRLMGTKVSYLNPATGQVVTGATVRAVATTEGDVREGSGSTAVWGNVTGVFDITSGGSPGTAISYSTERFAFDRRTGVLVNCCGAEVGTRHAHFSGQGFVWPIGVDQSKSYQIFDTTLLKPEPVQYIGTAVVDGLTVWVYTEHITNVQFSSVTLPGSLVGLSQATVTLPEFLTAANTYYVDPGTGSPVKVVQFSSTTLAASATSATALVLFQGTLTSTPQTVATAVHTAQHYDTEIWAVQDLGPLIALLLGLLLLVFGIALIMLEQPEEYEYEEDDEAVGAQA